MKQSGIIAIVFVVGCLTGGVAAQLVVPLARAGTASTRWEYQCRSVEANGGDMTSALNELGQRGWELASMSPAHADHEHGDNYKVDAYRLCAKRALP